MAAEVTHASPLLAVLEEHGGVVHDYHGRRLVRHFGDPHAEYVAATGGVAVFDRSHRSRLRVSGKAPAQMLSGVLTGVIPGEPGSPGGPELPGELAAPGLPGESGVLDPVDDGVTGGTATYHAVLTPKGRMITDLVAMRLGDEDGIGFLLDVPVAGHAGLSAHLKKVLPPRLAAVQDVSEEWASISVVGPEGAAALAKLALGLRVDADWLLGAKEGEWRRVGSPEQGMLVVRTAEVWPPAWSVYGPSAAISALWRALVRDGAVPAGLGVWSTLRVEAGRPVFGTDMDDSTIPPEAGIVDRAIDQTKGCYTGQEVIVRIRDRGHVNRHLRQLDLGDIPAPAAGTELMSSDGSGKVVGRITSVVQSPRAGGVLALAYVRRGVERVLLGDEEIVVPEELAGS